VKILLTYDYSLQLATADGIKVYEGKAGDTLTLPEDIAALFISAGAGEAVKVVKAKGETATK
jgi:hypothetical protein